MKQSLVAAGVMLLELAWALLLTTSIVFALIPRLRGEVLASRSARRRAGWLTAAFALAALPLALGAACSLPIGGPPNPLGMIAFVFLCAVCALGWFVLRSAWALARAAESSERRLAAELLGEPRFKDDSAPRANHLGLSGDVTPPTRW